MSNCVIEGCDSPLTRYTELCVKHYTRKLRHGDPNIVKPRGPQSSGGTINKGGYVRVWVGRINTLEHRHVMEKYLERKLKPYETVHHMNGVRNDNRIDEKISNWRRCSCYHSSSSKISICWHSCKSQKKF